MVIKEWFQTRVETESETEPEYQKVHSWSSSSSYWRPNYWGYNYRGWRDHSHKSKEEGRTHKDPSSTQKENDWDMDSITVEMSRSEAKQVPVSGLGVAAEEKPPIHCERRYMYLRM